MLFGAPLGESEIGKLSTLAIAQVGDSVFDLMVRTRLCRQGAGTAERLHRDRVKLVSAPSQARRAKCLLPLLDDAETQYYMRGRNAKPGGVPKCATREEYAAATALETVFGWLWLTGRTERLTELFEVTMDVEI